MSAAGQAATAAPGPSAAGREAVRLAWRIRRALLARGAWQGLCAGLLLAGSAAMPLRYGARLPRAALWPLLALPPLAALLGTARAWRRLRVSTAAAAALLDARAAAGGLVVSAGLPGWEAWRPRLGALPQPAVRWQGQRLWRATAVAALFAAAAWLLPDRLPPSPPDRPLRLGGSVEQLRAQLDTLADTTLDAAAARELEEELTALEEAARADDPAAAWDTLDQLAARLREAAAESGDAALDDWRQLDSLAAMTDALQAAAAAETLAGGALSNALQRLGAALQEALGESASPLPAMEMPAAWREALAAGLANTQLLAQLSRQLQACKGASLTNLMRLCDARLVDARLLEACQGGSCTNAGEAALAALLGSCQGDGSAAVAGLDSGLPGRGGVTRGPGAAPMQFGPQSDAANAAFVPQQLASASLGDLRKTRLQGLMLDAPLTDPQAPAAAGALAGAAPGGGNAHRRELLPHHRRVARAYFERAP
jgi:hypothetical protein